MREELVPEADALARAFDQSRHVGHDELPAASRSASARPDLLVRPDAREVAPARVGDEHDVAAAAAVAAVGPALGDELLAAEMDRAVAAAAGDHGQSGAIVEHRRGVGGD